jgi:hypothetical protein
MELRREIRKKRNGIRKWKEKRGDKEERKITTTERETTEQGS